MVAAIFRLPSVQDWQRVALYLLWLAPLLAIFAYLGGFATWQPAAIDVATLRLAILLFVIPALGEEILFRGLLLPSPGTKQSKQKSIRTVLAIALFVLWHPLQAWTFGPPWAGLFLNLWFLCTVAVLGIVLSRVYFRTKSLWPCVFVHWLVVASWKLFFGGPF